MRILLLISFTLFFSCSLRKDSINPGTSVDIYLLKTYDLVPGKCMVSSDVSTLQDTPFVRNEEILKYSRKTYEYTLTQDAIIRVSSLAPRTPFAITVDKQVIFFGFFIPSFISSTCDNSITMDVSSVTANKIQLRLGYPWQPQGVHIDDHRNNRMLLSALSRQAKLQ